MRVALGYGSDVRRWSGRGEQGHGFDDIEAGAAKQLVDDGLGQAGGVVLDADGLGALVEEEPADAVDLAEAGDGKCGGLAGGRAVAVEDVELGHRRDDSSGMGAARMEG